MRVLFSLRFSDVKESMIGLAAVIKTLGLIGGLRAIGFATGKQMAALARGEGKYPEKGKRRIWFKLNYLRYVYDYLKMRDETQADKLFESILVGPAVRFIANFIPPAEQLTKDVMLHWVWPALVERDYNVVAEARPPTDTSATLHVSKCFFNEVARDVGLMAVADKICYADFVFWEHYHPNITFSRTKTLIAGDNSCDHTLNWTE